MQILEQNSQIFEFIQLGILRLVREVEQQRLNEFFNHLLTL